jgi:adenine-specific DNA-methyltransferase
VGKKVFISGSSSISKINNEVMIFIERIISNKETILIGDCNGIDTIIQDYLSKRKYKDVIVYTSGDKPRNFKGDSLWETICLNESKDSYESERDYYALKDIKMTKDCDYALAIWDGNSKATKNNIDRVESLNKLCIVLKINQRS